MEDPRSHKRHIKPLECIAVTMEDGSEGWCFPELASIHFPCLSQPINSPENVETIGRFFTENAYVKISNKTLIKCIDIELQAKEVIPHHEIPTSTASFISLLQSYQKLTKTRYQAFDQIVQVLHAPYDKGDLFFRIFTGDTATNECKNGSDSAQIGDDQNPDSNSDSNSNSNTGSGEWCVKAGAGSGNEMGIDAATYDTTHDSAHDATYDKDCIVYEYKGYQPNGSDINVTGTIAATYRSKAISNPSEDGISFNKTGMLIMRDIVLKVARTTPLSQLQAAGKAAMESANDTIPSMVETLTIAGAYDATLTFTYKANTISNVPESDYDANLFESLDALFTANTGTNVEFTYAGETQKLNRNQLRKLLRLGQAISPENAEQIDGFLSENTDTNSDVNTNPSSSISLSQSEQQQLEKEQLEQRQEKEQQQYQQQQQERQEKEQLYQQRLEIEHEQLEKENQFEKEHQLDKIRKFKKDQGLEKIRKHQQQYQQQLEKEQQQFQQQLEKEQQQFQQQMQQYHKQQLSQYQHHPDPDPDPDPDTVQPEQQQPEQLEKEQPVQLSDYQQHQKQQQQMQQDEQKQQEKEQQEYRQQQKEQQQQQYQQQVDKARQKYQQEPQETDQQETDQQQYQQQVDKARQKYQQEPQETDQQEYQQETDQEQIEKDRNLKIEQQQQQLKKDQQLETERLEKEQEKYKEHQQQIEKRHQQYQQKQQEKSHQLYQQRQIETDRLEKEQEKYKQQQPQKQLTKEQQLETEQQLEKEQDQLEKDRNLKIEHQQLEKSRQYQEYQEYQQQYDQEKFQPQPEPEPEPAKTQDEAFDQVVKVLHAPYTKGDNFFRIFTGDTVTNESQNGEGSAQLGNAQNTGSGTWSVTAGKHAIAYAIIDGTDTDIDTDEADAAAENSIVYEYKDYQPNGSPIIVTGSMTAMYRTSDRENPAEDGIAFNKAGMMAISKIIRKFIMSNPAYAGNDYAIQAAMTDISYKMGHIIDTLKISGAYDATLTFTYKSHTVANLMKSQYAKNLFQSSNALFTADRGTKVEFCYNGETIELNAEQLQKLLHVI